MKHIYSLLAVIMLGISSVSAQTMVVKIEGHEIKNGDNVVIQKPVTKTRVGSFYMYDFGVEVDFTTNIAQNVATKGVDKDKKTPGLAVCPPGYTCTTAGAANNWTSDGTMSNLTAGMSVVGEWIHYSYGRNTDPGEGATRASEITLTGASETISFTLTMVNKTAPEDYKVIINNEDVTAVDALVSEKSQKANGKFIENGKVVIVKNGVKYNVNGVRK